MLRTQQRARQVSPAPRRAQRPELRGSRALAGPGRRRPKTLTSCSPAVLGAAQGTPVTPRPTRRPPPLPPPCLPGPDSTLGDGAREHPWSPEHSQSSHQSPRRCRDPSSPPPPAASGGAPPPSRTRCTDCPETPLRSPQPVGRRSEQSTGQGVPAAGQRNRWGYGSGEGTDSLAPLHRQPHLVACLLSTLPLQPSKGPPAPGPPLPA